MSVRALGARRLTRATVGMVVLCAGGVAGLVAHNASEAHDSTTPATQTTSTQGSTIGDGDASDSSRSAGSPMVTTTQSAPDATSGGS